MDAREYLDVIATESAATVAAGRRAGLGAPVPSCPGWLVADLFAHLGQAQGWSAGMVETGATEPGRWAADAAPSDPDELPAWLEAQTERLLRALEEAGPTRPMWTFSGPGTSSFWSRRQAHEVVMHRCDAELAEGAVPSIDADVARDGIDEFFEIFVGLRRRERLVGTGETVHVHCTDGDGEWLVQLTPDGPEVQRVHAKGDVAARGTASDLWLVLAGRLPQSSVDVFGDGDLLARFVDLSRL